MKIGLYQNKDFLSGLMFITVGAVAIFMSRDYPFGSALRMGPGYFPSVLGGIMVLFGLWVGVQGLIKPNKVTRTWSVRALIVLPASAWIFGVAMENLGFVPAMLILCLTSAFASPEFKFVEQLILAVCLTFGAVALFIWGLGLPYPLFAGH